jgi:alpha-ribazole phosphatase
MSVTLIRHSLTESNKKGIYCGGKTDSLLCEEGIKLAQNKCDISVNKVYSSPMKRCVQTAELMFPNAEITIVEDFREINFGDFEGKCFEELKDDKNYTDWVNSSCENAPPGGECLNDFYYRVRKAFDTIRYAEKDIIIVAHAGTIMSIMSYLCPDKPYFDYKIENCERLIYDEKRNIRTQLQPPHRRSTFVG